jgi:hypothetical protein
VATLGLLPRASRATGTPSPRAKRCVVIFMDGGPSHIDLWDVKPEAPAEIRGEFSTIQTSHPELPFSELLPKLSRHAHRFAVVRSVTHGIVDHNAGGYYMLTGRFPVESGQLVVADGPDTFPPYGAVLAKFRPQPSPLPGFIHVAEKQFNLGHDIPGQSAGFLGPRHDPFVTGDPSLPKYAPPGFRPLPNNSPARFAQRNELLARLNDAQAIAAGNPPMARMAYFQQQAAELITAPEVRAAFDLSREPAALREKYGLYPHADRDIEARKFGGLPHLGQSALLARRLLEAGVTAITLVTGRRIDQAWDTHRQHFKLMRQSLCPPFDAAISAFLDDLAERGLLDETLVVLLGEFGRTPKIGYATSNAGATSDGRDHWPYCYSVLFAGAGVQPGALYGASDRQGAYPARDAVRPEDIAATIYAALGLDPHTEIYDRQGRPYVVTAGHAIDPILS